MFGFLVTHSWGTPVATEFPIMSKPIPETTAAPREKAPQAREPKQAMLFDPASRVVAMAVGGALSLASTLLRGAWGWTAAVAGGALVKRGVTGHAKVSTPDGMRNSLYPEFRDGNSPVASNPGSLHGSDRLTSA
jgi:hypothetical protein